MISSRIKEIQLDELMPLIREKLAEGKSVKFSPMGISMLPMLRQGIDSVQLAPVPSKLKKYDLPLYRRDDGRYILHRIVETGETYTCVGDNQYVLEHGIRHDQMIALVTMFYRKDRAISVDGVLYRMYCVIWHRTRGVRHFCLRAFRYLKRRIASGLR